MEYNGELNANVCLTKSLRSPPPQGGLEISIHLYVRNGEANGKIYTKVKEIVSENCMEPETISFNMIERRNQRR